MTAPPPSADCAFCEIVAGRAPAHVVLDDASAVAFLDRRPLFPGHTLVVPRAHHETLVDLPPPEVGPFFLAVRELTGAVTAAMGADGSLVAVNNAVSQSVSHLHVHVVPRRRGDGLRGFFWPRQRYADDAAAVAVAVAIRDRVARVAIVGDDWATPRPAAPKEPS